MRREQSRVFVNEGRMFSCTLATTANANLNNIKISSILENKNTNIRITSIKEISTKSLKGIEDIMLTIEDIKKAWGSVAIQQALRSEALSYQQIADKLGVSKRTAWNNCNGVYGCLRWEERSNQIELIAIAKVIIKCFL